MQAVGKAQLVSVLIALVAGMATRNIAQSQGYKMSLPPDPVMSIPPGDDIILYIHGGPGSRLEEASDLAGPLLQANRSYTLISFDQPSQGYSQMIDPATIVGTKPPSNYYPLLAFSEELIVALVNKLGLTNHNVYIIGGSTGGALTLRMGRRTDAPWLKKIIAWNPASVWTSYKADPLSISPFTVDAAFKGMAADVGFGRGLTLENPKMPDNRKVYIDDVFGSPQLDSPLDLLVTSLQPNPEEWYRGDRDRYNSQGDSRSPFRREWGCKWPYIGAARVEQQEIYNEVGRRWHWRLGTEMLTFSFFNDSWVGPANNAKDDASSPNYQKIIKPTLLLASDDDDWNEGYVEADKVGLLASVLGPIAGGIGAITGPVYFHWEDRWTRTNLLAAKMQMTPLSTIWAYNTGHSIHNERPQAFAQAISAYISGTALPSALGPFPEENCQNPYLFPPIPSLLDDPSAAAFLMEPANLGGLFSDGSSPGTYNLRLTEHWRSVAQAVNPEAHLEWSALSFFNGDTVSGNAYADLSVSGSAAYLAFQKHPPDPAVITAGTAKMIGLVPCTAAANPPSASCEAATSAYQKCWKSCVKCTLNVVGNKPVPTNPEPAPGDPSQNPTQCNNVECSAKCQKEDPAAYVTVGADNPVLKYAVQQALTRAYQVAWALRRPDLPESFQLRQTLGWIAVSGEDDAPTRPVNVPSGIPYPGGCYKPMASYPQSEVIVNMCPWPADASGVPLATYSCTDAKSMPISIRYTVASSTWAPTPEPGPPAITSGPTSGQQPHPGAGTISAAPALTAVVYCLSADGEHCLPADTPPPPSGPRSAMVFVSNAGRPVDLAKVVTVDGSNQVAQATTNSQGFAVINYAGCHQTSAGPTGIPNAVPVPCSATATRSGYLSATLNLP